MDHLSTKRILITGGLGYIASEIFKIVKEYSGESLAVDKLADASGNVLILDLKDAAKTSEVINNFKPDVIIHCATHSALAYKDHLLNSFQEDFSATVNILDALESMPDCRLIYLSSSYVYSGLTADQNYDEFSPLAPQHNFGIAKSFFEQFILKINPNTVIFRLCSVFGSGQALHPNVILTFAKECLKNHSLTVWGRGERKLQYIYIKDVVNIILRSFSAHAKGGDGSVPLAKGEVGGDLAAGIYNLGGDDYISVRDTAKDIANFFSVKVNFLENKPEGETLPFLSNQKIKNSLKTLNYETHILNDFSVISPKFGLEISKNFQAEPLAKPENSIKFPSAKFGGNPAKEFRNSELKNDLFTPFSIALDEYLKSLNKGYPWQ